MMQSNKFDEIPLTPLFLASRSQTEKAGLSKAVTY